MEVTALCSTLMRTLMLLLVAQVHFTSSQNDAFPQVVPNRQQLFKYEALGVSCEGVQGLTGWRVMRKVTGVTKTCAKDWSSSTGPCGIKEALPLDSGEYWCVMGAKKSFTVNITVSGGPVILESPVLPVMEGEATTLSCRDKQASPNLTADFYKNGHLMERSSSLTLTILSVSRSNEGLYKCTISGAGESAESWLTVRDPIVSPLSATEAPHHCPQLYLPLCIGISVFLVSLLLLVGLLQWWKRPPVTRDSPTSPSSFQPSSSPETVYEVARVAVPIQGTHAIVTKPQMEKEPGGSSHCTRIAGY